MARIAAVTSPSDRPKISPLPRPEPPPLPECNFAHLLAHSRAATVGYADCEAALARGQLTAAQREAIALAVAEINGCRYCLSVHYARARAAGLSEEEMRFARKATSSDPKTDAMLRFAQALTLQRGVISDPDFFALRRAGITEGQIVEIVANVALNIFTNYLNMVVRTDLDFPLPTSPDEP